MRLSLKLIAIMTMPFMLSNCATIVSKSKWPVVVSSTPTGASVTITNKKGKDVYTGITPATLSLKSGSGFFVKESYIIKITMDGYDQRIIPLECKLNGWYAGNILIGGLIGLLIVDPATGAMYKLNTDTVHEKLTLTTAANGTALLRVLDINEIPQSWHGKLVCLE